MTTSIPYSFVPGTKAMASEVNANFIALADAVDENKSYITTTLSTFGDEWDGKISAVESSLAGKIDDNCRSNVITEIPQRIKYSLNSAGQISLTSGSEVFVNSGDGYESVKLTTSTSYGAEDLWTSDHSRALLVVYIPDSNTVVAHACDYVYHSSVAPSTFLDGCALWDDTANNQLKSTVDSGTTWKVCSLPVLSGKPGVENIGWNGYIDCIFNAFGFFGTKTFTLPDIKALFADGLNDEGTLKNISSTSDAVTFNDVSTQTSVICFYNNTNKQLIPLASSDYTKCAEDKCVLTSQNAVFYNTTNNTVYVTSNGGSSWSQCHYIYIGALSKTSAGKFTCMKQKTQTVNLLTNSDFQCFMPDYSAGYAISSGFTAPCDGWIAQQVGSTSGDHSSLGYVDGHAVEGMYTGHSNWVYNTFPIPKGSVYTFDGGTLYTLIFYPCKEV